MDAALRIAVLLVAIAEAAFIGLFAVLSLTGDGFGVARAMALLLTVPFLVFTVPALLLLRRGRSRPAALAVALSGLATCAAWRFA